jgi:effector-binding domain-containing protein
MRTALLKAAGTGLLFCCMACSRHTGTGLGLDIMKADSNAHRPAVTLERRQLHAMKLLYCRIQAQRVEEVAIWLNAAYVEICQYINAHHLSCGKVIGYYYTYESPYLFDAAMEVDSIPPLDAESRIKGRQQEPGEVLIAHYKGPYEKASLAYEAIANWLKTYNVQPDGLPFEVYLNDPVTTKDRSQLRTDVYQLLKVPRAGEHDQSSP